MKFEPSLQLKRESFHQSIRKQNNRQYLKDMRQNLLFEIQRSQSISAQQIDRLILGCQKQNLNEQNKLNGAQNKRKQNLSNLAELFKKKQSQLLDIVSNYGYQLVKIGLQNIQQKQAIVILGNLCDFKQPRKYLLLNNLVNIVLNKIQSNKYNKEKIASYVWLLVKSLTDAQKQNLNYFLNIKNHIFQIYQIIGLKKYLLLLIHLLSLIFHILPEDDKFLIQIIMQSKQKKNKLFKFTGYDLCAIFVRRKSAKVLSLYSKQIFSIYLGTQASNQKFMIKTGITMLYNLVDKIGQDYIKIIIEQNYFSQILLKWEINNNSCKQNILQLISIIVDKASNEQLYTILATQRLIPHIMDILSESQNVKFIFSSLKIIIRLLNLGKNRYENDILRFFQQYQNFNDLIKNLSFSKNSLIRQFAAEICENFLDQESHY